MVAQDELEWPQRSSNAACPTWERIRQAEARSLVCQVGLVASLVGGIRHDAQKHLRLSADMLVSVWSPCDQYTLSGFLQERLWAGSNCIARAPVDWTCADEVGFEIRNVHDTECRSGSGAMTQPAVSPIDTALAAVLGRARRHRSGTGDSTHGACRSRVPPTSLFCRIDFALLPFH